MSKPSARMRAAVKAAASATNALPAKHRAVGAGKSVSGRSGRSRLPVVEGDPKKASAKPAREAAAAKATTLRLSQPLQQGLAVLQAALKRPANKLINEAVEEFIERRSAALEADLAAMLARIRDLRKKDPRFQQAVAAFVDAEAKHGSGDPAEGSVVGSSDEVIGPSQRMVRALLG